MVLQLPETMTVRTAARFREDLLTAFAADDEVVLDAAAVAEVDLSFVQTLYAARDHAERHGKAVRLAAPVNAAVQALLERGGFAGEASLADIDFWFHGDMPR